MGATEAGAAEADRLVRRGHVVAAVDLLAGIYRTHPEAALARRLVELRHAATSAVEPGSGRTPWPPPYDDPFPNAARRVPEVSAADLSTDLLGGAVAHHGAVLVRGLFDHEQVTRTIEATDRAGLSATGAPTRHATPGTGPSRRPTRATTGCAAWWQSRRNVAGRLAGLHRAGPR